jgi:hypothetical protein
MLQIVHAGEQAAIRWVYARGARQSRSMANTIRRGEADRGRAADCP